MSSVQLEETKKKQQTSKAEIFTQKKNPPQK